jgi:wyosine [tRNA(Phe)-imidazoG37] synthetase (radical SAM superfamily)
MLLCVCKICPWLNKRRVADGRLSVKAYANAAKHEESCMSTEVINSPAGAEQSQDINRPAPISPVRKHSAAPFGYPRDFLDNRFVYLAISPRARGLSIGVNLNPDGKCNFNCLYCDVDRTIPRPDAVIDCDIAALELAQTLQLVHSGGLKRHAPYATLPDELLELRHVALSGDAEPTTSPRFLEAVETVVHVRARGLFPFFKIVLITNASGLDLPEVQAGINLLTAKDEVWAKLDAGTQEYMEKVNQPTISLQKVLANILATARKRAVIIQSLFSSVDGSAPSQHEISEYAQRLSELKQAGANIPLVQIYSATRPVATDRVEHLPLRTMSDIAAAVRSISGLRAEVF